MIIIDLEYVQCPRGWHPIFIEYYLQAGVSVALLIGSFSTLSCQQLLGGTVCNRIRASCGHVPALMSHLL